MSTHSFILKMRRSISPFVLTLPGGVLFALQLVLPSVALASPVHVAVLNPPSDPAFARAEVSVVRIVVSYTASSADELRMRTHCIFAPSRCQHKAPP
jgi:hypothetical protein